MIAFFAAFWLKLELHADAFTALKRGLGFRSFRNSPASSPALKSASA